MILSDRTLGEGKQYITGFLSCYRDAVDKHLCTRHARGIDFTVISAWGCANRIDVQPWHKPGSLYDRFTCRGKCADDIGTRNNIPGRAEDLHLDAVEPLDHVLHEPSYRCFRPRPNQYTLDRQHLAQRSDVLYGKFTCAHKAQYTTIAAG